MHQPPFLKPGDTIGIIAPSRKISAETLYPCIKLFESWGLKPILGPNIYAQDNQFAGSDQQRQHDLQFMLDHPSVKAIVCARGGYGTVRIMEGLNVEQFLSNPKWIIGYSDITVMHSFALKQLNCQTIHATMPVNYNTKDGETLSWQNLKSILFGTIPQYETEVHPFNKTGVASGKLAGGNLSVLYSLAGTPYDIDTNGYILFIEDLDEYLYHIDRMMMNFKLSGKLENIKGLIIGGLSDMRDNTIPFGKSALEILKSHVEQYNYPVMFNFPAGHIEPNLPLIFGREAELNVGKEQAVLRYL